MKTWMRENAEEIKAFGMFFGGLSVFVLSFIFFFSMESIYGPKLVQTCGDDYQIVHKKVEGYCLQQQSDLVVYDEYGEMEVVTDWTDRKCKLGENYRDFCEAVQNGTSLEDL